MSKELLRQPTAHANDSGDLLRCRKDGGDREDPALAETGHEDTGRIGAERNDGLIDEGGEAFPSRARFVGFDQRAIRREVDAVPAEGKRLSSTGERTLTTMKRASNCGASAAMASSLLPTPWRRNRIGGRPPESTAGGRIRVTSERDACLAIDLTWPDRPMFLPGAASPCISRCFRAPLTRPHSSRGSISGRVAG